MFRMLLVCYSYVLVWCFSHDRSDHRDQLFCLFGLQNKTSVALRIESRMEESFSIGINCMSLAVCC